MKTTRLLATLAFASFMLFGMTTQAQNFDKLDKSPMDVAAYPSDYKDSNKLVKIVYSRPQLKERTLDKLAPKGKVWRTGANEAAEITFYVDMKMGDKTIKAGTYSFATIPGESTWTIIINSDLNTWGAYFYDEAKDVARLTIPVTTDKSSLEAFSIAFSKTDNGTTMHLGWDTTRVAVPFSK